MGTLTILAGSADAYAVSGLNGIVLSDVPTEVCLTADINVVSGATPFTLEFRIENGTGAPGNGGEALVFDATVDGTGACSIGGNFADGALVNDDGNGVFDYNLGGTTVAVALASFGQGPLPEDLIVEISNIQLSYCTAPAADAGTLTADANACVDIAATTYVLSATDNGDAVIPADYEVIYVLTSGTGLVIEATSATPSFDLIALGLPPGTYTIHTLVAETSDNTSPDFLDLSTITIGVTTGVDVFTTITLNGLCASLDVTGAPFTVTLCPTTDPICTDPPLTIYTDYIGNIPCEASCGTPFNPGFDIWQNEAYTTGVLLAGSEYTLSAQAGAAACGAGYVGTVEVVIYAYDPATGSPTGPPIAFNSDMCGSGPLTFTVPAEGEYIIQVNDTGDCAADGSTIQADSGILSIDCGAGGAVCPPCVFDIDLVDAVALTTTTDIALASYCYNNAAAGFTFGPDTITIAFGAITTVDTDFTVTTNVGIDAGGGVLPAATVGLVVLSQTDLDNSGGTITITMVGINDPSCMGTLEVPVADLLQGTACITELCDGLPCNTDCAVTASTIFTTDPTRICIDGVGDPIDVTVDTTSGGGGMTAWVITDANGIILALPAGPPFDLDGAGAGQCLIWLVNYDDPTFAPMTGDDAAAAVMASSCAVLSNPITVDRIEVTAASISTTSATTICADDGIDDLIDASIDSAGIGANSAWVITDANGIILALPPAPPFNLEGAGVGTCLIWYVNWDDPNFAPMPGDDATALVAGATCAILSNSIAIEREVGCGNPDAPIIGLFDPCNCANGIDLDGDEVVDLASETITIAPGTAPYTVTGYSDGLVDMSGAPLDIADIQALIDAAIPDADGTISISAYLPADGVTVFSIEITDDSGAVGAFTKPSGCPSCATPDDVPTVGEWGLIILGLMMSITAVIGIRQRRKEEVYG